MDNIKNIKINGHSFELDLSNGSIPGYSGTVYKLVNNSEDLAVKIYRSKIEYVGENQDDWFPTSDELEHFINFSSIMYPIILSRYKVLDENDKYIGCCGYYVEETKGKTEEIIFDFPRDDLFKNIHGLYSKIPMVSLAGIILDDWRIENIKYGTITKFPQEERLYVFDDSNYEKSDLDTKSILTLNYSCFEDFILDLVQYFYRYSKYSNTCGKDKNLYENFTNMIRLSKNRFNYLEEKSKDYPNIKEFLFDYPKKYIKM